MIVANLIVDAFAAMGCMLFLFSVAAAGGAFAVFTRTEAGKALLARLTKTQPE